MDSNNKVSIDEKTEKLDRCIFRVLFDIMAIVVNCILGIVMAHILISKDKGLVLIFFTGLILLGLTIAVNFAVFKLINPYYKREYKLAAIVTYIITVIAYSAFLILTKLYI